MKSAEETTYEQIADYFIGLANDSGSLITNLKLQKLVYYAQSWSLALNNKPLFNDDFEAWVHGPVLYDLYKKYRASKWHPINKDISLEQAESTLSEDVKGILRDVADVYFELDAYKLEKLTHTEQPWIEARGSITENEPCRNIISKDTMKRYYAALAV